jgi:hypothetical protein
MSVIIAYYELLSPEPPKVRWQELKLAGVIPARVASTVLPHFVRWRRFVQPVFSGGDIVGIRISSLMTPRLARRLRAKLEPFLATHDGAAPVEDAAPAKRIVSLSKHGLCIPHRNLAHAQPLLEALADIELQYDSDEEHVVALLVPPGVDIRRVYGIVEVDAVTIEPSSAPERRHLLSLLYEDLKDLAARSSRRA